MNCHMSKDLKSLEELNGFKKERRDYPRMITSIPAFISTGGSGEEKLRIGTIINISLSGLLISIPNWLEHKLLTGPQRTEFEIITELPNEDKTAHIRCKSRRVVHYRDNTHVGASIYGCRLS